MKLDVKAFIIAFATPITIVIGIISIWSRLSLQFGLPFMKAYNSIHPHPFTAQEPGLVLWEHVAGVGLDVSYMLIDMIVLSGFIVLLYNRLAGGKGDGAGIDE